MEQKSIRQIISENEKLHFISVSKQDKHDRNTWMFNVNDSTSAYAGISDYFKNYPYRIVALCKGCHYFLGYQISIDGNKDDYYVDPRKANHRTSPKDYIKCLINYLVYSNDISYTKDVPSFKVTSTEMRMKHIDNYLDLCAYYGNDSAIGTGITRNVRNIVVMDIDVDCEREDNANELNKLIMKFGKCNALPDFIIHNHNSKHVQLQWLIKSFDYKLIDQKVVESLGKQLSVLTEDSIRTNSIKEIRLLGTNFLEISPAGMVYRKYTRALTNIVNKHKFGDKQYTFWKAKNFYTALLEKQHLELKVPYMVGDEIRYRTKEEMNSMFGSKEGRRNYYDNAPTFDELCRRTDSITKDLIDKISDSKVKTIKDDDTECIYETTTQNETTKKSGGLSRNNFVLECTRTMTWEIARKMKYKEPGDIRSLEEKELKVFMNKIHRLVKTKFKEEDKKYGGCWPDTSNHSAYRDEEFESTFQDAFWWAVGSLKEQSYSDQQRKSSSESRHLKKDLHLTLIDHMLQTSSKMKQTDLLITVNNILSESGHKKISMTTLKRCVSESKKLTHSDRVSLYENLLSNVDERKQQLEIAKSKKSKKYINTYTKRFEYISINTLVEQLREFCNDTTY